MKFRVLSCIVLLLIVTCVAALAACQSEGNTTGTDSTTQTSSTSTATGDPPLITISHYEDGVLVEARAFCLLCHETGLAEATMIPDDHAGRTNDMCQGCHLPATE